MPQLQQTSKTAAAVLPNTAPVVVDEKERRLALLKRVRTLRESILTNRGEVKGKKPNKDYVWVNTRADRRTYFEGLGYQVCRDPDIQTRWKKEDGTHQRGDLILYECDRELREAIRLDAEMRSLEAIEGPQQSFEAFAERSAVPLHHPKV